MWEPKSLQTKSSVSKRELAGNGRASFSACYVKTLRGGNSPGEALFAKKMIKDKLIVALIDSGSSVNIISDTLYKQFGEPSQIRMCNKNIIAANNGKMPIMGSADIQVQLQKFTCEITVKFLLTTIEITPCLLGIEFLYNFDCILNLRKNELFCGAIGKTLQLSPSQRSNKNQFLIAAEDHELPRRCEGFIKCKIIDEEGNITQQTGIIVEPMNEFEDKSHLLIARLLNDMVDDVVWVRVLNPTLEPKKVYKNARIACAENIEKISRVQQNNPDNNKKHRDE